jgi:hypothetical protein
MNCQFKNLFNLVSEIKLNYKNISDSEKSKFMIIPFRTGGLIIKY